MTVFYFMPHTIYCRASLSSSSNSIRQLEQTYVSSSFGHAWLLGGKTADMVQITVNFPPVFFLSKLYTKLCQECFLFSLHCASNSAVSFLVRPQ